MTVEKLMDALHARPFRPFSIRTADALYRVEHPDFVARSPSGRTIVVYQPDESSAFVDLLLVSEIEFDPPRQRRKSA